MNPIIYGSTTQGELLAQLAEECSELAQAALKLRRAITVGASPTDTKPSFAFAHFREECADVLLTMHYATNGEIAICASRDIEEMARQKEKRWAKRIQGGIE